MSVLRKLVLFASLVVAAVGQEPAPAEVVATDAIRVKLDEAITSFTDECHDAARAFSDGLRKRMEALPGSKVAGRKRTGAETVAAMKHLQSVLDGFESHRRLPDDEDLQDLVSHYVQAVAAARSECARAFDCAVDAYAEVDLESLKKAEALLEEKAKVLAPSEPIAEVARARTKVESQVVKPKAASYGTQLLANPGCEDKAEDGISGWREDVGDWRPRSKEKPKDPEPRGNQFFSVVEYQGQTLATLSQTIDVTAYGADIKKGRVAAVFGGWVAALGPVPSKIQDESSIRLQFLSDVGRVVEEVDFGFVHSTEWRELSRRQNVPTETVAIRMLLVAQQVGGGENNAYFDDLHLKLVRR